MWVRMDDRTPPEPGIYKVMGEEGVYRVPRSWDGYRWGRFGGGMEFINVIAWWERGEE